MTSGENPTESNSSLCIDPTKSTLSEPNRCAHEPVAESVLKLEQAVSDLDIPHTLLPLGIDSQETPTSISGSQPEHLELQPSGGQLVPTGGSTASYVSNDPTLSIRQTDQECGKLMEKLERLSDLMCKRKILLADLVLDDIEQLISKIDRTLLPSEVKEAISKFESNSDVKSLKRDAQNVRVMIRQAQTKDPNWILSSQDKKRRMKSFHRVNNDSNGVCFKVEARSIKCNIFNLLALFIEFDLLPAILSTPLASIDIDPLLKLKFRKLMRVVCTPIWPFSPRDVVLDMSGFDVLDQNCVVLCGESFDRADDVAISAPETPQNTTRMLAQLSGVVLRPLGQDLTSLVVIAAFDLKLGSIPPALLQFVTKKLTLPVFQVFVRQAEKLSESQIHQDRLSEDHFGVYEMIRDALHDYDYDQSRAAEEEASSQIEDADRSTVSISQHSSHLATI